MNLRSWFACISILVGSLAASPRRALAEDEATEQARKHYQEAQKQFDLGMWDAAIREFTEAYELRPDPNFLYNMAQAYRRGEHARRAIDLYKNYLIKVPKSPQRAEVEERIRTLQKQLEDEEREGKRATPPTPTSAPTPSLTPEPAKASGELAGSAPVATAPDNTSVPSTAYSQSAQSVPDGPTTPTAIAEPDTPPVSAPTSAAPEETAVKTSPARDSGSRALRIGGIVAGAAGLAGIGGGILFSVRTKSLSDSTSQAKQFNSADARAGKQAATLQWVCYGTGGAAVVAGALLYWRGRTRGGEDVGFAPMLVPGYAGLSATGAF